MAFSVAIVNFEGPLDLLLQLVERSKLDITAISLGQLTQDYLSYLAALDNHSAEDLHQFIELATRLTYIKSLALLPEDANEGEEEIELLRSELAEYKRFRSAAQYLASRPNWGSSFTRRVKRVSSDESPVTSGLTLKSLSESFRDAIASAPEITSTRRLEAQISVPEMSEKLLARISLQPIKLAVLLSELKDRLEIIVAFLAILELIKHNQISVSQSRQFNDIIMSNEPTNA